METEARRFSFGMHSLEMLEFTRASLLAAGFTVTEEVCFVTHHKFELHTLVAVPPEKPTRKERGCFLSA